MLLLFMFLAQCDLGISLSDEGLLLRATSEATTRLDVYALTDAGILNFTKELKIFSNHVIPMRQIRQAKIRAIPACNDTIKKNNYILYTKPKSESNIKPSKTMYLSKTAQAGGYLILVFCFAASLLLYHEKDKFYCKDHRGSHRRSQRAR